MQFSCLLCRIFPKKKKNQTFSPSSRLDLAVISNKGSLLFLHLTIVDTTRQFFYGQDILSIPSRLL